MAQRYSQTVSAWVRQTKERQEAVYRESIQRELAEAQEVGPSVTNPDSTGTGHMPVATGFLRASLVANLGDTIPSATTPTGAKYSYNDAAIVSVLSQVTITDEVTAAWTANYARYVEHRYAFMRLAAQQWPRIVTGVCSELRARAR